MNYLAHEIIVNKLSSFDEPTDQASATRLLVVVNLLLSKENPEFVHANKLG